MLDLFNEYTIFVLKIKIFTYYFSNIFNFFKHFCLKNYQFRKFKIRISILIIFNLKSTMLEDNLIIRINKKIKNILIKIYLNINKYS